MYIDLSELSPNQAYYTLTQTVVPRPIAWVLSDNQRDTPLADRERYNLAPFSFFTAIGGNPPLVMISVGKKPDGSDKDTLANIAHHAHFVLHIAAAEALDAVNQSAATLPHGESEVRANQLSLSEFAQSPLPRVSAAPVAMSCRLHRLDEIGNTPQTLIFGEVEQVWVDDTAVEQYQETPFRLSVNATVLDPLARLGGTEYAQLGEISERVRPA